MKTFTSNVMHESAYEGSDEVKRIGITFTGKIIIIDKDDNEIILGTPKPFVSVTEVKPGNHAYVGNTITSETTKEDIVLFMKEGIEMTANYLSQPEHYKQLVHVGIPVNSLSKVSKKEIKI